MTLLQRMRNFLRRHEAAIEPVPQTINDERSDHTPITLVGSGGVKRWRKRTEFPTAPAKVAPLGPPERLPPTHPTREIEAVPSPIAGPDDETRKNR